MFPTERERASQALMFEVAGTRKMPPYEALAYRAVEACGRLSFVLAVAGGILADAGGKLAEDFVSLISEDNSKVLREGGLGDEHVRIEDRLITASLHAYDGAVVHPTISTYTYM